MSAFFLFSFVFSSWSSYSQDTNTLGRFINLVILIFLGENVSKIVGASKVTSRYQVTIPQEVREKLGVSAGDILAFVEEHGRFYVTTKA